MSPCRLCFLLLLVLSFTDGSGQTPNEGVMQIGLTVGSPQLLMKQSSGVEELDDDQAFGALRFGVFGSYPMLSGTKLSLNLETELYSTFPTTLPTEPLGRPTDRAAKLWQAGIKPMLAVTTPISRGPWRLGLGLGVDVRRQIVRHTFITDYIITPFWGPCFLCNPADKVEVVYGYGSSDMTAIMPVAMVEIGRWPRADKGAAFGFRIETDLSRSGVTSTVLSTNEAMGISSYNSTFTLWASYARRKRPLFGSSASK